MHMVQHANASWRTRGCANFIRWSSPLRGRHRTMAANPIIWFGSKLAHTETTVLDQLKKSQQNRATAFGSCQITAKKNDGPAEFTDSAHRMYVTLLPSDLINLSFSSERAQGHFLSPWSKSGAFYTKEPRYYLCVYQSVRFEKAYCWCFEKIANFFLSFFSLLSE
jgi:hypothetical protein